MSEIVDPLIKFIFVLVGTGGWLYSLLVILQSRSALKWKKVTGTINYHGIEEKYDIDGSSYEVEIEYSYSYRGKKYNGKRVAIGLIGGSLKSIANSVYKMVTKESPTVKVFINPRNPKMSTLLVGFHKFHIINIVFFTAWNIILFTNYGSG